MIEKKKATATELSCTMELVRSKLGTHYLWISPEATGLPETHGFSGHAARLVRLGFSATPACLWCGAQEFREACLDPRPKPKGQTRTSRNEFHEIFILSGGIYGRR